MNRFSTSSVFLDNGWLVSRMVNVWLIQSMEMPVGLDSGCGVVSAGRMGIFSSFFFLSGRTATIRIRIATIINADKTSRSTCENSVNIL